MSSFSPVSGLLGGMLIGLASALMLWGNGRIAGISGIIGGIREGDALWRLAFLAAMGVGGMVVFWLTNAPIPTPVYDPFLLISAGLLVGIGTGLGKGCTSGHGVCGLARFSLRSFAAVTVFMTTAMMVVLLTKHLL